MKRRRLGRTSLWVSEIGLGTMTFGSFADERESLAILDRAFDADIDFLDTAEIYPVPPRAEWAGRSEEIVGKWLAGRPRDAVVIASKVAGPGGGWFLGPLRSGHTSLDRHNIERAVEESLRRLGTDYLDLYQTHWSDPDFPIEQTLEALDRLVEEGKVRAIGCSNFSPAQVKQAKDAASKKGLSAFVTCQDEYSLLVRSIERELAPLMREHGMMLLPYAPLAGGFLSGKYRRDEPLPGNARLAYSTHHATDVLNERNWNLAGQLREFALRRDRSMLDIAFGWLLARPYTASVIAGAMTPEQIEQNVAAGSVMLSAEDIAALDRITA